jgi:hypothetical protein
MANKLKSRVISMVINISARSREEVIHDSNFVPPAEQLIG